MEQNKLEQQKKKEEEQKRRFEQAKAEYNAALGVGYEPPQEGLLEFKDEPLDADSLLGTYELVFYSSDDCDSEDIHRTAKGVLKLSMSEWSTAGTPALLGRYCIDNRATVNSYGYSSAVHGLGEHNAGSFIELVKSSNWSIPEFWDGFDIINGSSNNNADSHEFASKQGRKEFLLCREAEPGTIELFKADLNNSDEDPWWNDLEQVTENEYEMEDMNHEYCGAVLKVVAKRHALGLASDQLYDNMYRPNGRRVQLPQDELENVKVADKLMAQYRDGSNSWMCSHLQVPPDIAFKIREFVTPPPVFFLEENDLMLVIQESNSPEWEKQLIFRKVEEN